jgi:hypothetical protein
MAEDTDEKRPVEVTREELYRQVWQTPMQRLAQQYGITGNGLAKICDRLNVPYPPRGYWAKVAAGKDVAKYRLLSPDAGTPRSVTIMPTPPPEKPSDLVAEIAIKAGALRSGTEPVVVPEKLSRPHPIIERWLADHAQRKREASRERDPWRKTLFDPGDFSELDRRCHRVLDAFFKAIEKQKGSVKQGERHSLYAEMNGEKIEFQLREKQKQTRRPLTSDEKRWASKTDKGWRQQLDSTGRLVFAVKTYLPNGLRTEWLENDRSPMEALLPDIVAMFLTAGPVLAEQRAQREEAARLRHIAEMKRYEREKEEKLDNNRWRRFVEFAQAHRNTAVALDFLNALKTKNFDPTQEVAGNSLTDWIAWAEDHLVESDPLNSGPVAIFSTVSKMTEWTYRD